MNDQAGRVSSAGQTDVYAVLVDVLIDKGIVTQQELFDRLRRAQAVAARRSAGFGAGEAPERLDGETVLVVEEDPALAQRLMTVLERAGAEVLVARDAAQALSRVAQFDFSAAVLDWRPERSEHRALTRWLREDGVRILFHAAHPPEDAVPACGDPILAKAAPAAEIVGALARLTGPIGRAA
jgi:CheY-like chemotaxis protein